MSDMAVVTKTPVQAEPEIRVPTERRRVDWPLVAVVGVLVLYVGVISFIAWPGHMNIDTIGQIEEMRTGPITDWHAGLLLHIWRPFWRLGYGIGWAFATTLLAFVVGIYSILRVRLARVAAVIGTLLIVSFPPVLGFAVNFGRDQWTTSLALATFGALAWAMRSVGRRRNFAFGVAIVMGLLMLMARQNAVTFAIPCIGAALSVCGPWRRLGRFDIDAERGRSLLAIGVRVGLAGITAFVAVFGLLITQKVAGVKSTRPEQATYLWDLVAISHRSGEVLLDETVFPSQDIAVLDKYFDPYNIDTVLFVKDPPIRFPVPPDHVDELRSEWLHAIRKYPLVYAHERWQMWTRQIAWSGDAWWIFHPFIDENPWGTKFTFERPKLDHRLQQYLYMFTKSDQHGNVTHRVWIYLLGAVVGLAGLRSKVRSRRFVGWMCVAVLLYQASVLFGTMGVNYRYSYPCVVLVLCVAVIGTVDGAASLWRWWGRDQATEQLAGAGQGTGSTDVVEP
ncbi:MAG: hypothetical protein ABI658_16930 [Acidimicrobiales bacterium]